MLSNAKTLCPGSSALSEALSCTRITSSVHTTTTTTIYNKVCSNYLTRLFELPNHWIEFNQMLSNAKTLCPGSSALSEALSCTRITSSVHTTTTTTIYNKVCSNYLTRLFELPNHWIEFNQMLSNAKTFYPGNKALSEAPSCTQITSLEHTTTTTTIYNKVCSN
jgi:thioredoxin reductase